LITNDLISEDIKTYGVWEPEVTNYLIKNIKPHETIIEVGANIGYYTVLMAKLVSPSGRIYSYEANGEAYDLANLSLNINGLSEIVKLKNMGILDKTGNAILSHEQSNIHSFLMTNIGATHIVPTKDNCGLKKNIRTVSLDEDLSGLKNVDWLKMDIEGSELLALRGAKRIISSSPNLKIVMEWSPRMLMNFGSVSDLIDLLHGYGFKFYEIEENGILGEEIPKPRLLEFRDLNLALLRNRKSNPRQ
jgi:FkbM family methyltransferase